MKYSVLISLMLGVSIAAYASTYADAIHKAKQDIQANAQKGNSDCGMSLQATLDEASFKGQDPDKLKWISGTGSCGTALKAVFNFCMYDTLKDKVKQINSFECKLAADGKNKIEINGSSAVAHGAMDDDGSAYFQDEVKNILGNQ